MRNLPVPEWLVRSGLFSWLALGVLGFAAVIILGLSTFSAIVLPVIFSAVAAAVFAPIVDGLQRWGVPRSLGSLLTLVLIIGGLIGIIALVTRSVIDQADQLAAAFTVAFEDLQAWLADFGVDEGFIEQAREAVSSLASSGGGGLVSSAAGVASSAAGLVLGLFFGLVFLFFLMRDAPVLPTWASSNLDEPQASELVGVGRSAVHVIRRYFTGRAVVALFDSVVISVGAAVLGIPLVPAIAILTFIGGFVPYLGAVIAGTLAVVLGLASGGFTTALIMLAIVLLTQNVLEPLVEARVIGQSLGLHPMLVIIATTIGGIAAGFSGLILGAPLAATVVKVRNDLRERSRQPDPDPPEPADAAAGAPASAPAGLSGSAGEGSEA
ncbi:MAG: AI-2E family transporter [Jiangellales bacterium]